MIIGQKDVIKKITEWNMKLLEIHAESGVSQPTIRKYKKGVSVTYDKHIQISQGVERIIEHREKIK